MDSTNNVARKLVSGNETAIVVAESQTHGRGRHARTWHSPPGGIYASWLLFPSPVQRPLIPLITLLTGLACAQAFENVAGLKPEIAWPNDILVNDHKLAGILCEGKGSAVIVGCGINVNQSSFPPDLPEATSLRHLTGQEFDRYAVLGAVAGEFRRLYDDLTPQNIVPLLGSIKSRMTMLGRPVRAEVGLAPLVNREYQGQAVDLDETGRLVIRLPDGRTTALNSGTVRRIR